MSEYRFERLSDENLFNLIQLYKVCFNLVIHIDFLRIKYNTSEFGQKNIGYLAFENRTDELAGYYGVFPIIGILDHKLFLIAQSGDTMTHPRHQGKGLFTKLAIETYKLAANLGVHFIFGFPNNNSYPGFKNKLGWEFCDDINNYSVRTNSMPFDKLAKKINCFNYFYLKYITWKLTPFLSNKLFMDNSLFKNKEAGYIVHDDKFYRYKKYFKFYRIQLNGILCIIKIDGRLWVGDIESCSKETFEAFVKEIIKLAKKLGCSSVHFSVTENTLEDEILKDKYPVKSKNPVGFINLLKQIDPSLFVYKAVDFDTY